MFAQGILHKGFAAVDYLVTFRTNACKPDNLEFR